MVFLKVAYAFVMSEQKEYILGITENHTIEGYDIPVITSLNNQESNLFFNERCLFLFKFVADVVRNITLEIKFGMMRNIHLNTVN